MLLKIEYGGSGDIKTPILENAQKTILQCRAAKIDITIDSNMVMTMINEILDKRTTVSEFTLDVRASDVEEFDYDDEPELPVVELRKTETSEKERARPKVKSKQYWLDAGTTRRKIGIGLILVITSVVLLLIQAL